MIFSNYSSITLCAASRSELILDDSIPMIYEYLVYSVLELVHDLHEAIVGADVGELIQRHMLVVRVPEAVGQRGQVALLHLLLVVDEEELLHGVAELGLVHRVGQRDLGAQAKLDLVDERLASLDNQH